MNFSLPLSVVPRRARRNARRCARYLPCPPLHLALPALVPHLHTTTGLPQALRDPRQRRGPKGLLSEHYVLERIQLLTQRELSYPCPITGWEKETTCLCLSTERSVKESALRAEQREVICSLQTNNSHSTANNRWTTCQGCNKHVGSLTGWHKVCWDRQRRKRQGVLDEAQRVGRNPAPPDPAADGALPTFEEMSSARVSTIEWCPPEALVLVDVEHKRP